LSEHCFSLFFNRERFFTPAFAGVFFACGKPLAKPADGLPASLRCGAEQHRDRGSLIGIRLRYP
jgi:hypothetical protein